MKKVLGGVLAALGAAFFLFLLVVFGMLMPGAAVVVGVECLTALECSFATGIPRTTVVNHGSYAGGWAIGAGVFWLVLAGLVSAWMASGLLGVLKSFRPIGEPLRWQVVVVGALLLVVDVVAVLALDRFFG